jgi:restriction endonuclease Mrr
VGVKTSTKAKNPVYGLALKGINRNIIVETTSGGIGVIIDLSAPRAAIKDKIDLILFEAKMRDYKINKRYAAAALAVALTFSSNNEVLAFQNGMKVDGGVNQNLYALIFSFLEVIKQFSTKDLESMRVCFNSAFIKNMFK